MRLICLGTPGLAFLAQHRTRLCTQKTQVSQSNVSDPSHNIASPPGSDTRASQPLDITMFYIRAPQALNIEAAVLAIEIYEK